MTDWSSSLNQALSAQGLPQQRSFIIDDQIHRFNLPPDRDPVCWYSLHQHGDLVFGAFGNWKKGGHTVFCSHSRSGLTPDQVREMNRCIRDCRDRLAAEESAAQERVRRSLQELFAHAPRARDHAYLARKGIAASPSTAVCDDEIYPGWLLIPLQDLAGTVHSAQYISPEGAKRFAFQGRMKGCFHQFSDVNHGGPILICEGYATGGSLYQATGWTTVCAMNCGNLETVARSFRNAHPTRAILIAADNDQFTENNPGMTRGRAAARAAQALIAFPEFADEALAEKPTDFNDLHRLAGLPEVKRQVQRSFPILKLLAEREWNPKIRPPESVPVFRLKGIIIATQANISTITAAVKSGKSAGIESMAAATMAGPDCDTLGFESANPEGRALLHFDSEQSPEDHWHHVDRIIRRSGVDAAPKWLKSWCLTGLTFQQCQECVWEAMRIAKQEFPGILAVLIDGYGDLVADVNDAPECNDLVARLHGLAIEYLCHISGVIHLNPGTEKSRGHLGSQLERKAETNLSIEKHRDDDSSLIFSTKNRRAGIPRHLGIAFKWDDDLKMHVSCERIPNPRAIGRPSIANQISSLNTHDFFAACPTPGEGKKEIARRLEIWLSTQNIDASFDTCKRSLHFLIANGKLAKHLETGLYIKGPNA